MNTAPHTGECILHAQMGTDDYTLELRTIWTQIHPRALPPRDWKRAVSALKAQQRWENLETQHLRCYPVLARRRHLQVLHPQVLVAGLDVSAYPVGLGSMFGLAALSLNTTLGETGLGLSLIGGIVAMFVFDRVMARSYQRALNSFGLGAYRKRA